MQKGVNFAPRLFKRPRFERLARQVLVRVALSVKRSFDSLSWWVDSAVLEAKILFYRLFLARHRKLAIQLTMNRKAIGLFADLNWFLYGVRFANSVDAKLLFELHGDTYFSKDSGAFDVLEQYFDTQWRQQPDASYFVIRQRLTNLNRQLPYHATRVGQLSLWEAHSLAIRYLQPLPAIRQKVERFIDAYLGPDFVGIHWRGTDKISEAPAVCIEQIVQKTVMVCRSLEKKPACFFLASDDQDLISLVRDRFKAAFPDIPVKTRSDVTRATDGMPVHLRGNLTPIQRRVMGEDALIDCLILARSMALIRTSSFLSGWCSVFNPALPVYMLNAPYSHCTWFPDREVLHLSNYFERRLDADHPLGHDT